MSAEYADRFITLNGCRLHYQEWGAPDAPPLVMVHGLTQQSHSFDGLARHLAPRRRCIALDVRGRGESEWAPRETYNLVQYAKDVLALLDALGLDTVDYVGTSMGGLTAMALARKAAGRLRRVALNDIGPELGAAGLARIATSVEQRSAGSFADVDDYIEHGMLPAFPFLASRPREVLREAARWNLRQQADGRWISRYDPAIQGGATADDAETKRARDAFLWQGFRALAGPLLLIHGADSDLLLPATVQAMHAAQPGLVVAEVPGVGHAPTLTEPEALAAADAFFA
jgi:pimeloyl-ACP methyl ester carboxylesterase